jgi:hypothetical protein
MVKVRLVSPAGHCLLEFVMSIELKSIEYKNVKFQIFGISCLVMHQWSEKARRELREKHAGKKTKTREKRDVDAEAQAATYKTKDGDPGIPAIAFKSSLITAAHKDLGIEKTLVRKAIFTGCADPQQVLPIGYSNMEIREDLVRVGAGAPDLRYRPYFHDWTCDISLEFEPSLIRLEDLVKLVDRAGLTVGIGEWRPEKGGEYGRFRINHEVPIDVESSDK